MSEKTQREKKKDANSKAVQAQQRAELDKTRIENEKYMRDHPELNNAVQEFVLSVLKRKPDDVRSFAVDFFTRPIHDN